MRLLGIDYGGARVGLALGDTETRVASPWRVIANEDIDETIDRIGDIAKQERVEGLVLGIPYPLEDQSRETDQAREIRAFAKQLARLRLPIEEQNETLSSVEADRQRKQLEEKKKRDDLAAMIILQRYLDRL